MHNFVCTGLEHPDLQAMYSETGKKWEKLIKILDVACLKAAPILSVWPAFFVCFITYLTSDMDGSAFQLPNAMW